MLEVRQYCHFLTLNKSSTIKWIKWICLRWIINVKINDDFLKFDLWDEEYEDFS